MDIDTIMDIDSDISVDIEKEIQYLDEYDNERQLELLKHEIGHITIHGIQPSEGWYDERFKYINKYCNLDWSNLALNFYNKDAYIYNLSASIVDMLSNLTEERSTKPNFSLDIYNNAIHHIYYVWNYYKEIYLSLDMNEENDMIDLINGIRSM